MDQTPSDPLDENEKPREDEKAPDDSSLVPDQSAPADDEPSAQQKLEALLGALPEGKLSMLAQVVQQWQGPLPPPEWLAGYNNAVPGLADRLMTCFEQQVNHRIGLERTVVEGNVQAQGRGQWFAFMIALALLALAFLLVTIGYVGWGIGVAITDISALAGLFIYGREGQKAERKQKIDQIVGPRQPPPSE